MTALTIFVPRLNDELWDAQQLVRIWQQVDDGGDGAKVSFYFSRCDFLRPNAVAYLGGLARMIEHRGGKTFRMKFLSPGGRWQRLRILLRFHLTELPLVRP